MTKNRLTLAALALSALAAIPVLAQDAPAPAPSPPSAPVRRRWRPTGSAAA